MCDIILLTSSIGSLRCELVGWIGWVGWLGGIIKQFYVNINSWEGVTRLQMCIDWGQTIVRYFSLSYFVVVWNNMWNMQSFFSALLLF